MKRVVIVGAGYAGVRVAYALARRRAADLDIVLVSDQPYHVEIPALYEVATAYLDRESSQSSEIICEGASVPLDDIFMKLPVTVTTKRVARLNPSDRLVFFADDSSLSYDVLVLALGAAQATYGIPGVEEYAFSIKTLTDALRLRHHIVRQFFLARRSSAWPAGSFDEGGSPRLSTNSLLTFVVVGGGAAGVETAAELTYHARKQCRKLKLDPALVQVVLVEAGDTILKEAPLYLQQRAKEILGGRGIRLIFGTPVTAVTPKDVWLKGEGDYLPTRTVIWTAGLKVAPLLPEAGFPISGWGVSVEPTLLVRGQTEVFAAGDCASLSLPVRQAGDARVPATVPVAYAQGALVAGNILRLLEGKPLVPYHYNHVGALITVGGKQAIALLPGGRGMIGLLPWLLKKLVSLRYWNWYLPWWKALYMWWRGVRVQCAND